MLVISQETSVESRKSWLSLRWYGWHDGLCARPLARSLRSRRRGLTLIELLVVIILLTTLVAAAIPILSPTGADREIREATRGLNTFITGSQTRSTQARRPYGIALKRLSQDTGRPEDNGVCVEVYYAEQQPPYSGFDSNSRVCFGMNRQLGLNCIHFVTRGNSVPPTTDWLPIGWDPDLFPSLTIQFGDVIEIGDTRYVLKLGDQRLPAKNETDNFVPPGNKVRTPSPAQITEIVVEPINNTGQLVNTEYDDAGNRLVDGPPALNQASRKFFWTPPMPYKILRKPTITSDPPYQLPQGTAIDLRASGFGTKRFFQKPAYPNISDAEAVDNNEPVIIMFTPEGRVEKVNFDPNVYSASFVPQTSRPAFAESVVDNVYLLIGKRENIPGPGVATDATLSTSQWSPLTTDEQRLEKKNAINWLNGESRWVVVGSQSGRVVSVENAAVDPLVVINDTTPPIPPQSSEPMRTRQILKAREFTSEMANVGGR